MRRLLPVLLSALLSVLMAVPLLAGCSPSSVDPALAPLASPPSTWLGLQPGDARAFSGPAGELVLIYVDETYAIDGVNASALTFEHDDTYVTDYFTEADGGLTWLGRRGEWRAGRGGEKPRAVPLGDTVTFGDITITLGDDGPVSVETPEGVFTAE